MATNSATNSAESAAQANVYRVVQDERGQWWLWHGRPWGDGILWETEGEAPIEMIPAPVSAAPSEEAIRCHARVFTRHALVRGACTVEGHAFEIDDALTDPNVGQACVCGAVTWPARYSDDLRARIRDLEDRIQRLTEIRLKDVRTDAGLRMTLASEMWPIVAKSVLAMFIESGGTNLVEFIMGIPDQADQFILTVQRRNGKTPMELKAEVEKQRDAWRDALLTVQALVQDGDMPAYGNLPQVDLASRSYVRLAQEVECQVAVVEARDAQE